MFGQKECDTKPWIFGIIRQKPPLPAWRPPPRSAFTLAGKDENAVRTDSGMHMAGCVTEMR
jgi:hypothetical protein